MWAIAVTWTILTLRHRCWQRRCCAERPRSFLERERASTGAWEEPTRAAARFNPVKSGGTEHRAHPVHHSGRQAMESLLNTLAPSSVRSISINKVRPVIHFHELVPRVHVLLPPGAVTRLDLMALRLHIGRGHSPRASCPGDGVRKPQRWDWLDVGEFSRNEKSLLLRHSATADERLARPSAQWPAFYLETLGAQHCDAFVRCATGPPEEGPRRR